MTLFEFLSKPEIQLPVERTSDDYQRFIETLLDQFERTVDQLDAPATVASETLFTTTADIRLLQRSKRGRPSCFVW